MILVPSAAFRVFAITKPNLGHIDYRQLMRGHLLDELDIDAAGVGRHPLHHAAKNYRTLKPAPSSPRGMGPLVAAADASDVIERRCRQPGICPLDHVLEENAPRARTDRK